MSQVRGQDAEFASDDRRIAEASRQIGVSPRVLRYWEQMGVVKPSRDPAGRRHFSRHDLLVMALVRELLDGSQTSISDLRLVREVAELEVSSALADPLTRLKLLFQRQAAEPYFHSLLEEKLPSPRPPGGPLPPHRLGPAEAPLPPGPTRRDGPAEGEPGLV